MTGFGERIVAGFHNVFEGELLHSERSEFQKVDVYEHEFFGRVLTLDDLIQTTTQDEFCYHEMLVHPTLASREEADRVLIIGGGDGGTLRHALMHDPKEAVMCEIDEVVVRVSREYLADISSGAFDDPRAKLVIGDGAAFVADHEDAFDAIIIDSTDPIGAAAVLFSKEFYESCRRALRSEGVLVAQTGSPFYQGHELVPALSNLHEVFANVETYAGFVPTYPGVLWSYCCATDGTPVSNASGRDVADRLERRRIETRFYTPEGHNAAFALPAFVRDLCATATGATVSRR